VDYIYNEALGTYVTVLRTEDQPRTFHNDVQFAILREAGTDCHYTTANTPGPLASVIWDESQQERWQHAAGVSRRRSQDPVRCESHRD